MHELWVCAEPGLGELPGGGEPPTRQAMAGPSATPCSSGQSAPLGAAPGHGKITCLKCFAQALVHGKNPVHHDNNNTINNNDI